MRRGDLDKVDVLMARGNDTAVEANADDGVCFGSRPKSYRECERQTERESVYMCMCV